MAVYIISNAVHMALNQYKFGRTITSRNNLETTYQRYLNGAKILHWFEVGNSVRVETDILTMLDEHRCVTANGNKNEWIAMPLVDLRTTVDRYLADNKEVLAIADISDIDSDDLLDRDILSTHQLVYIMNHLYPRYARINAGTFMMPHADSLVRVYGTDAESLFVANDMYAFITERKVNDPYIQKNMARFIGNYISDENNKFRELVKDYPIVFTDKNNKKTTRRVNMLTRHGVYQMMVDFKNYNIARAFKRMNHLILDELIRDE